MIIISSSVSASGGIGRPPVIWLPGSVLPAAERSPAERRSQRAALGLSLSDSELSAIVEASRPLAPRDRAKFVEAVAVELSRFPEIGPGIVGRVVRDLQKQHLSPPRSFAHLAKYDRGR
jgi:hypothetical protein